jgi:hypothetical protein
MRRAPFAVVILPYAVDLDGEVLYAVFRARSGRDCAWHVLPAAGERGETPLAAARREALLVAGIPRDAPVVALDSRATLELGDAPAAISEFAFAMRVLTDEVLPRDPQLDVRWVSYEIAYGLLCRESDRNALWELRRRLGHPAVCR